MLEEDKEVKGIAIIQFLRREHKYYIHTVRVVNMLTKYGIVYVSNQQRTASASCFVEALASPARHMWQSAFHINFRLDFAHGLT